MDIIGDLSVVNNISTPECNPDNNFQKETALPFQQVFIKEEFYEEAEEDEDKTVQSNDLLEGLDAISSDLRVETSDHILATEDTECEERVNDFGYGEELSTVGGEMEAAACPSIQLKRKPDKCGHCSYTTVNPQQLMQHFQTNHADQYPFVCDFCDFRCLVRKTLNVHTRTEHAGEKRFSCEFCDYKAVRLIYLKRHVVVHSDEKRFSCEFCDFKTRYHSNLRTHLRNHTDEKPYRCELCEYSSRFLSNLKTHQRTHTGDKLFSCDHCDYKTSFSGNLRKHVKSHK
ncbi:zinc finger protein 714-like [Nilaparvata lugens]|uniref:zinc finger protein 714-like n=1 Tax=Nilaparvata lugens TaxID=108931 RepID=UPI00193DC65D|nr:zinc finger protein 714-like [Nilaparvata lugens]